MPKGNQLQSEILAKLARLQSGLRRRLLGEGLAWVAVSLAGLVLATLGLDYLLRGDRLVRGMVMTAALAGVGWVAWHHLLAPLRVSMSAKDLALLVESRWSQLGDRFISALQFAEMSDAGELGMSEALIDEVTRQANELVGPLDFGQIVEKKALRKSLATAALSAGLVGWLVLWQPGVMGLWLERNVMFRDADWPQNTYLDVQGDEFVVLRGGDLKVEILPREGGEAPSHITLHARYPSVGATEERLELQTNGHSAYAKVFQAVAEEFEFYVTGGDDSCDKRKPHRVRLIDAPALRDVVFRVHYHPYTGQAKAEDIDGGRPIIGVPVGSRVEVFARTNKDIRDVSVFLEGKACPAKVVEVPSDARDEKSPKIPRGISAEFTVSGDNKASMRTLRFNLKDSDGFTNPPDQQQYMIQVQPDLAPVLEIRKFAVGANIAPRAIVPVSVLAKDDFGVATVRVQTAVGTRPAQVMGEVLRPPVDDRRDVRFRREVDLDGLKLMPGDVVRISAAAEDTLPLEFRGPNTGASPMLEFRVVKPEDLMAELVRRQKELTIEFMQATALQEQARAKSQAAAELLAGGAGPEVQRKVEDSAHMQVSVGSECAKAADVLRAILDEMKYNRLGSATDYNAMSEGIIKPIQDLARPIQDLSTALSQMSDLLKNRPASLDAAKVREQAASTAELQKEVRVRMEDILQRMQRLEGQLELANQLKVIIDWSEDMRKQLKALSDRKTTGIFDSTSQPAGMEPKAP